MPSISANGIDIYYEDYGTGKALILIQGLTYATPMWHWQAPELKKHFRVVIFDNRGSGQSSKPDIPYSIKMFADDAVALMDALKIERANVLGISMGGLIAQELALLFPARVHKLVLCSTFFGGATALLPNAETTAYLAQYQEKPTEDMIRFEIAYGTASGFSERFPDRVEKLMEFKKKTRPPRFAYFRQLMSGVGYVNEDRLANLSIPTLILTGRKDRIIPIENSFRLHNLIPGSEVAVFENSGHHPHIEEPEEFNRRVTEYLLPSACDQE
jgi:pimeloyl-ACP methyl ester carboxylesterase